VGGVDAAVEDGDTDAFAGGGVPRAMGGSAGDVIAVTAYLLDGPTLRGGGVVGVVGAGWWWRWCWGGWSDDGVLRRVLAVRRADGVNAGGFLAVDDYGEAGLDDGMDEEMVSGDDAVVDDVFDVGLRSQLVHDGGVVQV